MDWITKCIERYLAWRTWTVRCAVLVFNRFILETPHWTFSVSQEGENLPVPASQRHLRWCLVASSCQNCCMHALPFLSCLWIRACNFTTFLALFKNETKVYFKTSKRMTCFSSYTLSRTVNWAVIKMFCLTRVCALWALGISRVQSLLSLLECDFISSSQKWLPARWQ